MELCITLAIGEGREGSSPGNGVVSFEGSCGREARVQMIYEAYFL